MRLFAGAGEASGDRMLAAVLRDLRVRFPDMEIRGFGGPLSVGQGLQSLYPLEELAANGVGDVLRRGVRLGFAYFRLRRLLRDFRPDLVLLADYPGMNLGLARLALRLGYRVHYVAPPQLWAYRSPGRRLARLRLALRGASLQVLFPFENGMYAPWATRLCQGHFLPAASERPPSGSRLLLCPGSRPGVLRRNLPLWLNRLSECRWAGGVDVLIPEFLAGTTSPVGTTHGLSLQVMFLTDPETAFARASAAIAFPGTITLELFLRRVPTRVWGILDPITLRAGRRKLRSRNVALPNLLLEREIFPEWIGTAQDFKRRPPECPSSFPAWPAVTDADVAVVLKKTGSSHGAETGLRVCLELLESVRR